MKRVKRRNPYRGRVIFVMTIVLGLAGILSVHTAGLRGKARDYAESVQRLETKIEVEQQRTEKLKEQEQFMNSTKYIEQVAREKLGLIYPDEILLRPEDTP